MRSSVRLEQDPLAEMERRMGLAPSDTTSDPLSQLEERLTRERAAREERTRQATRARKLATVPADATRRRPGGAPDRPLSLPERAGAQLIGFGKELVTHPVRTVASVVSAPLHSAAQAIAPSAEHAKRLSTPGSRERERETFIRTARGWPDLPAKVEGVTGKERAFAVAQTAANLAAGPVAVRVARGASKVLGPTAARAAGGAVAGVPIGAAYTPDDPGAGALAMATLGGALSPAGHAIARPVGRVVRATAEAGARGGAELLKKFERRRPPAETAAVRDPLTELEERAGIVPPDVPARAEAATGAPVTRASDVPTGGVQIARVPVDAIRADPVRFQYKRGLDPETGTGGELKSLSKFDEMLAGVISVWRDPADGYLYAINGHNRIELARRTGHPSVNVQFLDAPNAAEARAMGALSNIAEGRGTAVDAATFFREAGATPAELADRVSFKGTIARRGAGLSKLAPDVFDRVVRGESLEDYGVAIGSMLDDSVLQRTAMRAAEGSSKRLTEGEVRELARQVREAGTEITSQETLFGEEQIAQALWVEKAQLAEAIRKRLTSDKRLFGYVAREGRAEELARAGNVIDVERSQEIAGAAAQLTEAFQQLYTRSGPVAQALTESARRIAHGESFQSVVRELYPTVQAHLREALPGGEGARVPALGARDPVGELEARHDALGRQVERGPEPPATEEVVTPPDPNQTGFFSPARRGAAGPDLFGEGRAAPPRQESLFEERAGTEASRPLSNAERAAIAELEMIDMRLEHTNRPAARQELLAKKAQLERLVNRGEKISAAEIETRRRAGERAELPEIPTGPDQGAFFSPVTAKGSLGVRVRKTLRLSPSETARVWSLGLIARNMAKALDVPLSQGRFWAKQRQAMGVFSPHSETTRVRRFDQLGTVAHEIGHYLSKRHLRNPTQRGAAGRGAPKLSKPAMRELIKMGRDLYGNRKPTGGYGEEGIAQWVRHYVTDPELLATKAPEFTRFMDTVLAAEPDLARVLGEAQSRFQDYRTADANARTDAMISVNEKVRDMPTVEMFVRAVFDDLEPIRQATEALGKTENPRANAYTLARLTRGSAGAAEEMILRGVTNFTTGERVTASLTDALRAIPRERLQPFRRYLISERTIELAERGIDSGQPVADARAIVEANRAEFAQTAQVVWDYSKALLEYRRDAGLLTPDQAKVIWQKNQRRVGFHRVFDPSEQSRPGQFRGREMARSSAGLPAIKGSSRRIIDPLEEMLTDVYTTVQQSNAHFAAQTLLETALRTEGGGRIAEIVEPPKRAISIPAERLKSQILERLTELGLARPGEIPMSALKEWEGAFTTFEEKAIGTGAEAKDLVMPVLHNGKKVWLQLHDPNLFNALNGLDKPQLAWWWRWVSLPTRTLRAGATLTVEFMARNPVRDAWTASVFGRAGFRPPGWNLASGLFHALSRDEVYQRWRLEGGDNAAMLGLDRPHAQAEIRRLLATGARRAADVVLHPIDHLRLASNLMENATRLGEFAAVERAALERQNLTRENASPAERRAVSTEAAFASRDVTVDFARAGHVARQANMLIAFLNASLQGNAKLVRELRERPRVVVPRILATITLPSLTLWMLQKDDPAYQELPRWRKDVAWNIIQRGDDGNVKHIWSIPKPFELGILFGTVPERIAEWIDRREPGTFDGLVNRIISTVNPLKLPTPLTPLVENWANKSFFRGTPIVPPSVQSLEPAEQVAPRTGEAARLAGRAFNYPPAKIVNLVRGFSGGLGEYGMRAADALVRGASKPMAELQNARPDDPLSRVPGVRAFVAREPGSDAQSVERLYDQFDRAEARRQTWNRLTGQEAETYLEKHFAELASVATAEETSGAPGWLREAWTELQRLNRERRQLVGLSLSPAEKLRYAREIEQEMVRSARMAFGREWRQ